MLKRLFGKRPEEQSTLATLEKLNETLETLEKKERYLNRKIDAELDQARELSRAKNKKGALACLKRKKMLENQVEQLGNFQLRIHDQMIMLEGAKATTETLVALQSAGRAMQQIHGVTNINEVDKTIDELNEQRYHIKQIQDSLGTPIGDFDDDDLEAELEDLEAEVLEKQPSEPSTAQGRPAQSSQQNIRQSTTEEEVAALQAETV